MERPLGDHPLLIAIQPKKQSNYIIIKFGAWGWDGGDGRKFTGISRCQATFPFHISQIIKISFRIMQHHVGYMDCIPLGKIVNLCLWKRTEKKHSGTSFFLFCIENSVEPDIWNCLHAHHRCSYSRLWSLQYKLVWWYLKLNLV